MNPRLPAVGALVFGVPGAALAAVVWPLAIPLGLFAIAAAVVTLLNKPVTADNRRLAIGGLVLGVAAIALGAVVAITDDGSTSKQPQPSLVAGIATGTPDAAHPPQKDIENPLPCRVEIGALRAGGKITNSSGGPSDYTIIVVWEEEGKQIGRNSSFIKNVVPGLTTSFEVSAAGDGSLRTTCRVERVDRTPSG